MAYEERKLSTDYVAPAAGFLIVRLKTNNAGPGNRVVVAQCTVDGVIVASGSAADNYAPDVISSPTQTFTVPVHGSSTYRVDRIAGNGDVEIRWAVI